GIDAHLLHFVATGHQHLDHAAARAAFHFELRDFFLGALHVLLQLLRLLHEIAQATFHHHLPCHSSGRTLPGSSAASNSSCMPRTVGSRAIDSSALCWRAAWRRASRCAGVSVSSSPTCTLRRSFSR